MFFQWLCSLRKYHFSAWIVIKKTPVICSWRSCTNAWISVYKYNVLPAPQGLWKLLTMFNSPLGSFSVIAGPCCPRLVVTDTDILSIESSTVMLYLLSRSWFWYKLSAVQMMFEPPKTLPVKPVSWRSSWWLSRSSTWPEVASATSSNGL